jgi:hypothetical protein
MASVRAASFSPPLPESSSSPALNSLLFLVILNFALQPLTEPDFGWHLRTGLDVLHSGLTLPATDPYSHTMPDWAWVEHAWLTDVLIAGVYSLWGGLGVIVLFATLTIGAWITASATAAAGAVFRWLACALSLWVALPYLGARTQLVTLLGLAVLSYLLKRWQDGVVWMQWWIPPLFLVWANLHGGFTAGLFLLLLVMLTTAIVRWLSARRMLFTGDCDEPVFTWPELRQLMLLTVFSAGLTLVNPYGWRLHAEIADSLSNRFMLDTLNEWQPLSLNGVAGHRYGLYLGGLALATALSYRRVEPVRWAIGGVFLMLSFRHMRNIPFFLIVSLPYCAEIMQEAVGRVRRWFPSRPGATKKAGFASTVLVGAILLWLGAGHLHHVVQSGMRPADYFKGTSYPIEAVEWVRANREAAGQRLYNDYAYGGFLLWWLPDTRVFIDGRMPAWHSGDRRIFQDYIALTGADPDLTVLTKYSVDWAVVKKQTPLEDQLSHLGEWSRIYEDHKVAIYRLRTTGLESSRALR